MDAIFGSQISYVDFFCCKRQKPRWFYRPYFSAVESIALRHFCTPAAMPSGSLKIADERIIGRRKAALLLNVRNDLLGKGARRDLRAAENLAAELFLQFFPPRRGAKRTAETGVQRIKLRPDVVEPRRLFCPEGIVGIPRVVRLAEHRHRHKKAV